MKQGARQTPINEYTQEEWSGFSDQLLLLAMRALGALVFLLSALGRILGSLGRTSTLDFAHRGLGSGNSSRLLLDIDKALGSLNLAVTNRSQAHIWVEEARVNLIVIEAEEELHTPRPAVLTIRQPVAPSETLHISASNTIYNTAGRPRGVYSCTISAVLHYRADESVEKEFHQSFPSYRARMIALVPISLRRIEWLDRPAKQGGRHATPQSCRTEQTCTTLAKSDRPVRGDCRR